MNQFKNVPFYVQGSGKKKGLIVIQEWWGISPHMKRLTKRFSDSLDAVCICPDLYRGELAETKEEASHLFSSLDWQRAVEDIRVGVEWLKSQGVEKIGITGFCMGGALSIAAGVKVQGLDAGSCFYGIPDKAFADPKDLNIPFQFHFGNRDHAKGFSDKAAADQLKLTLETKEGFDVSEFHQYDADHAFMNEDAPAYPYNEPVAKEAYAKTIAFFKKHLE